MTASIQTFKANQALRWGVSLCMLLLSTACAIDPQALAKDPYEASNRRVFAFNEGLDTNVLKPSAQAYDFVIPKPVQNAVDNFTNNIKDVWSLTNLILQGQGASATYELMRIGINSTLGLAGLVDVATDLRLDRHNEDLGQTLAVWGVPNGAYLVVPVFGPSTVRDAAALPFDQYVMPTSLFHEARDINAMRAVQVLNTRSKFLAAGDLLDDAALDKYAFMRDAYLQRRRNLIYNGEPPEEDATEGAFLESPTGGTLFTANVRIPSLLTQKMPVRINTAQFWTETSDTNDLHAQDPEDAWAAEIELPTLSEGVAWQTVSTR